MPKALPSSPRISATCCCTFAEDMRVILIMIADRVNIMRQIKDCENDEARRQVANEAAYLYAPLAHKLGLYKLKSELEDLSLKYTEKEVYYHIKDKLNETKGITRQVHRLFHCTGTKETGRRRDCSSTLKDAPSPSTPSTRK